MATGVVFSSPEDFDRMTRAVKKVEGMTQPATNQTPGPNLPSRGSVTVKITGTVNDAGFWPGVFVYRDADDAADPWVGSDGQDPATEVCMCRPMNAGVELEVDKLYPGDLTGIIGYGSSEVRGFPFVTTHDSGGGEIGYHSYTEEGIVSTTDQGASGHKSFANSVSTATLSDAEDNVTLYYLRLMGRGWSDADPDEIFRAFTSAGRSFYDGGTDSDEYYRPGVAVGEYSVTISNNYDHTSILYPVLGNVSGGSTGSKAIYGVPLSVSGYASSPEFRVYLSNTVPGTEIPGTLTTYPFYGGGADYEFYPQHGYVPLVSFMVAGYYSGEMVASFGGFGLFDGSAYSGVYFGNGFWEETQEAAFPPYRVHRIRNVAGTGTWYGQNNTTWYFNNSTRRYEKLVYANGTLILDTSVHWPTDPFTIDPVITMNGGSPPPPPPSSPPPITGGTWWKTHAILECANADAPTSSIYYSTENAKLVFKDPGGTVHDLY